MKKYGTHSRYYLYVKFKPHYGTSFTYNSDDSRGAQRGLEDLLRRVLRRSVKGRYEFAKLVDRETQQVMSYFIGTGEMFTEASWKERYKAQREIQPYLKGGMAFYQDQIKEREKYALPPLLTIFASTENEYGKGLSCALLNLRRQVVELKQRMHFRMVYLWLHPANRRIGQLRPDGITEITDREFHEQLRAEGLIPEPVLRIKLKDNSLV